MAHLLVDRLITDFPVTKGALHVFGPVASRRAKCGRSRTLGSVHVPKHSRSAHASHRGDGQIEL